MCISRFSSLKVVVNSTRTSVHTQDRGQEFEWVRFALSTL